MPCAFCGLEFDKAAGRARTGEHAVPTWTLEVIPGSGGPITHTRQSTAHGSDVLVWRADTFEIIARKVCEKCNSGWMEGLETQARRYLTTLIRGNGRPLHREAQTAIAAWSAKTALALLLTTPEKPAPVEHYRHMAEAHTPPPNTQVALGAYDAKRSIASSQMSELSLDSETFHAHGYATTLAVGHLVVQVFAFGGIEKDATIERGTWSQALQPIWPIEREPVMWPSRVLDDAALGVIAEAFMTPR